MKCTDCKGTGRIQLLTTTAPCATCGGSGDVVACAIDAREGKLTIAAASSTSAISGAPRAIAAEPRFVSLFEKTGSSKWLKDAMERAAAKLMEMPPPSDEVSALRARVTELEAELHRRPKFLAMDLRCDPPTFVEVRKCCPRLIGNEIHFKVIYDDGKHYEIRALPIQITAPASCVPEYFGPAKPQIKSLAQLR